MFGPTGTYVAEARFVEEADGMLRSYVTQVGLPVVDWPPDFD